MAERVVYEVTDLSNLLPQKHHAGLGSAINSQGNIAGRVAQLGIVTNHEGSAVRMKLEVPGYDMGPNAINDRVSIAGSACEAHSYYCRPFVADRYGKLFLMHNLDKGVFAYASGINSRGTVVGSSWLLKEQWVQHAFVADPPHYRPRDLGSLGGGLAVANGINDSGIIVGWSTLASNLIEAFRLY